MSDNPTEFNYTTTDKCDQCGKVAEGTMFHANSASGMATPVLFVCKGCTDPAPLVRVWREASRLVRRAILKAKYYYRTTPTERAARRAKLAAIKAKMVARRSAS